MIGRDAAARRIGRLVLNVFDVEADGKPDAGFAPARISMAFPKETAEKIYKLWLMQTRHSAGTTFRDHAEDWLRRQLEGLDGGGR